jgi:5'-deoxynucleotidase YfbR-like HD superfamily hydrolase
MKPDIHRLLKLQALLADFNQVERVNHRDHLGNFVPENDTEHSYNLAITAWFLAQWFPELDRNAIIQYALVHDIVEIHAGDTSSYASAEERRSKAEREAEAIKKLKKDWADFKDMIEAIEAYETKGTAEARFVYALDKLMPAMGALTHKTYHWRKHGITTKMFYENKVDKVKLSPEIYPYFEKLHQILLEHPELIDRS